MFKWQKLGRVFNPQDVKGRDWAQEFAQAPATLVFDNFVRVYFATRPPRDANSQYVSYTGFVDLDRKNLLKIINVSEKPIMPLGEKGTFDEFGTYPTTVIRKEDYILGYYAGWTRCVSVPFNIAIGAAISRDNGVTFKKLGTGPVLSYTPDEPYMLSGPKIRKYEDLYYLYYISGKTWTLDKGKPEPVYQIRMATSKDALNWVRHNKFIIPTKLEENEPQASPDVFRYKDKYHMFFCYRYSTDYRGSRGYRIGYASSIDLINWERDDSKAGIDIGKKGAWDDESIAYRS